MKSVSRLNESGSRIFESYYDKIERKNTGRRLNLYSEGLNRTMIGLKVRYSMFLNVLDSSLNRTMIGLKWNMIPQLKKNCTLFESYYDRIERLAQRVIQTIAVN